MKKLSTTILILIIAITANAQIFGSFDRTFRKVTLDSAAAYNDSIYMLGPITFEDEPFIMGQLLSDFVGGGSVDYGSEGQVAYNNPTGDGFNYTPLFRYGPSEVVVSYGSPNRGQLTIDPLADFQTTLETYYFNPFPINGSALELGLDSVRLRAYSGSGSNKIVIQPTRGDLTGDWYLNGDPLGAAGGVNYGTDGQFPFMNPAGDGFLYTTLLYDGANLDFGSNFSVGESSGWVFAKQYRSKGAGYRIDMGNASAYSIFVGSSITPFRGLVYDSLKDTSLVDSSLTPKRYVDKEMAQYELHNPETAPLADTWYSVMGGAITGNQSNGFSLINDAGYVKIVVDFDGYLQFSGKATFEYIGKARTAESIELRPTVNGVSNDLFYTSVDRSFDPDTFYEVVSWVGEAPVSAGDTLDVEWRVSTTNLRLNGRNGDPAFALFLKELKVKEQSTVNFTPIQ